MADGTIFDQTQETALTAAHRLLVQDTSAATASQSATFALMGGLEHNAQTVTTADITGAVGQLYYCTIAGLTADRNLTLPASAQVGERIGVYIADGDATYELIIKGAATVTINGGSAATEWGGLSQQGECVIFRCVGSTDWIVESNTNECFRLSGFSAYGDGTTTKSLTASGTTLVSDVANTVEFDPDSAFSTSTGIWQPTKAGLYLVGGTAVGGVTFTDNGTYAFYCEHSTDGSTWTGVEKRALLWRGMMGGASGSIGGSGAYLINMNGGTDRCRLTVYRSNSDTMTVPASAANRDWIRFWARYLGETS